MVSGFRPALIAGDPAVGHPIGRTADQGLDRLDVGRDPRAVVASQVAPGARLGVLDRVEAGVARQQDDAVSVVRLDEARPGVGRVCGFMVEPKMSTTTWSVARWISVIRRAWSGKRLGSRGIVLRAS